MSLFRYTGPDDRCYLYLAAGPADAPTVAPHTVSPGDLVDLGDAEPPSDGFWEAVKAAAKKDRVVGPDNAPEAPGDAPVPSEADPVVVPDPPAVPAPPA